ncbi:MAG: cache domain-containing protein, partial [Thermoproteota archaeon]
MLPLVAIAAVAAIAFGSYAAFGSAAEENVKKALLEQQKERLTETARSLSKHISSDIDSIVLRLQLLASQPALQSGELDDPEVANLLKEANAEINSFTLVDGIVLLKRDNVVTYSTNYPELVGIDASFRDYIVNAKQTSKPVISEGLMDRNGKFGVGIAVPITGEGKGGGREHLGMLVAALPSIEFFGRYGNVLDINSEYIVALDREGNYLVAGLTDVIGKNFFSDEIQELANHNPQLHKLYSDVILEGKQGSALFEAGFGERLVVSYPVFYRGEQVMSVVYGTPTATIYGQVNDVLSVQRLQTVAML